MTAIDAMPLYVGVDRIHAELAAMGIGPGEPLHPARLYPFDQFHYHGVEAIRGAAGRLGLRPGQRVLDVGSGLGGPARCLAAEFGCMVTALELQPALHEVAIGLTERCGLSDRVMHVQGDALTQALTPAGFDAAISVMVIHHVEDRTRLLRRMASWLAPGGGLFVEDLYARAAFPAADAVDVDRLLFGRTMTGRDAYETDLKAAGFDGLAVEDTTDDWSAFCQQRAEAFVAGRARFVSVHGQAMYAGLEDFFTGVARLFAGGSLGGLRIVAQRSAGHG